MNNELLEQYRELDRDCAQVYQNIQTIIPNEKNISVTFDTIEKLKDRVINLYEADKVFAIVKHHLEDFIDSLEYELENIKNHPERKLLGFNWTIDHIARCDKKPNEEKCNSIITNLSEIHDNYKEILKIIKDKNDAKNCNKIANIIYYEQSVLPTDENLIQERFPDFASEQCCKLTKGINDYVNLLRDIIKELSIDNTNDESIDQDDLTKTVKMENDEYRILLDKKFGVSLDELLSWYKEEIEKTRSEVFEIASSLDIPESIAENMGEINEILFRYEPPCNSAEEMISRANEYLKRTRALAHEFVCLPDDEICKCVTIPESCKDSYPWGGYEGGDFSFRPFQGQMFLNNYNYKNVTDGWIKLNALHEAYPGHHVQYIKAAISETPETVKIGAKLVPLLEGTCLRTERSFEFIYGEDPFFPLFVAYRRHHASVRIYVDLMLYHFGATLEEVIKIYQDELGFDFGTARKQVQAHQNQPGYFTCYYYGMKKITQWEKEYNFNKKDFTELIFSAGYISISRLEELIKLSEHDRERYFHDFNSLLAKEIKTK